MPELSLNEQRMLEMYDANPHNPSLNVYNAIKVTGPVSGLLLREIVRLIASWNPDLFTTYHKQDGTWHKQQTPPTATTNYVEITNDATEESIGQFLQRPFDLATGPLFRFGIFTDADGNSNIVFKASHVVIDAQSARIMYDMIQHCYALASRIYYPNMPFAANALARFLVWQQYRGHNYQQRIEAYRASEKAALENEGSETHKYLKQVYGHSSINLLPTEQTPPDPDAQASPQSYTHWQRYPDGLSQKIAGVCATHKIKGVHFWGAVMSATFLYCSGKDSNYTPTRFPLANAHTPPFIGYNALGTIIPFAADKSQTPAQLWQAFRDALRKSIGKQQFPATLGVEPTLSPQIGYNHINAHTNLVLPGAQTQPNAAIMTPKNGSDTTNWEHDKYRIEVDITNHPPTQMLACTTSVKSHQSDSGEKFLKTALALAGLFCEHPDKSLDDIFNEHQNSLPTY
jgi:hypothetical protein